MAGLKQIKSKIRSVEKTHTVTKAMEAVSAAKMRRAQHTAQHARTYVRAATSILARVSGAQGLAQHPLTRVATPASSALYIVITSDKGLAGALNSAVLRRVEEDLKIQGFRKEQVTIVAVGKKANDYFSSRNYTVAAYHPNTDELTSQLMTDIVQEAVHRFTFGGVDMVKIAYQNFVSTFEQRPTVRTIFPLSLEELSHIVSDVVVSRGQETKALPLTSSVYMAEPSEEEIFEAIVPRLASIFVYHALLESQASEHSARMVAMKSASDKADEMQHALTLQFNKARQAAITREVSEITGGMEAMAQ